MGRKRYITSDKPRLSQSSYSQTGGLPTRAIKEKPTEPLNNNWWFPMIEVSQVKPSKITPEERRRILAQENADFGLR